MPYIHLANGETKHLSNDEMTERFGDDAPRVFVDNNKEMTIVGIYPDDVEVEQTEEDKPKENQETQSGQSTAPKESETTMPQESSPPQEAAPTQSRFGDRGKKL